VTEALLIQRGERVLDVGTGTGAVAIRAARSGAQVVAVDISTDQLAKARAAADAVGAAVELVEADCQQMPLGDAEFDAVVSVFGVVFAPDHTRAGSELARVCRPGGRLAMTSWTYDEFSMVGDRLGRDDLPGEDAREWSSESHARACLDGFDLSFERGQWVARSDSADAMWELIRTSVPPLKLWLDSVSDEERERARRAYSSVFPRGELRRDYVRIRGTRR
jgi:SAM-dependent methyltransferase